MPLQFEIIELEQGTPEWLSVRLNHVTASNVPAIQNISPYKTRLEYFEELFNKKTKPIANNHAMQIGHQVEIAGREYCESHYGFKMSPAVVKSKVIPDLLASLDGFNIDQEIIFESKYVGAEVLKSILESKIPDHHYAQVQSQLLATGAKQCIYFAQNPAGEVAIVEIKPSAKAMTQISEDVTKFMQDVREGNFPEPSDRDFISVNDLDLETLRLLKLDIDKRSEEYDTIKKRLDEKYKDVYRLKGNGVMMYRSIVKGSVQYAKIPELQTLNLDAYRAKPRTQVTFKLTKE